MVSVDDFDDPSDAFNVDVQLGPGDLRNLFEHPTDNEGAYHSDISASLLIAGRAVGKVTGTLLHGELITHDRLDLFETMDNISHELLMVAEAIIGIDRDSYRASFWSKAEPNGLEILHVSRLTIEEGFRGHGLGLALMQHLLRYCYHDVALLKPFPLQHERVNEGPKPEFADFQDVPKKQATAKLKKHYARLGFKHLARTEFMYRSMSRIHKYVRFDIPANTLWELLTLAIDREATGNPPQLEE